MKLALGLLLLLTLCKDTVVCGFALLLLPPSLRSLRRNDATAWSSDASTLRPRCERGAAATSTIMMRGSFWEGLVQGVGGTSAAVSKEKCPVLICPAQLSVPGDYRQMVAEFKER